MLVLTPSQEKLLEYIKAGRFRSVRTCAIDLGYAIKTTQDNIQILRHHGLVQASNLPKLVVKEQI